MMLFDKVTHVVKTGDLLWALAKKLNTSVAEITQSNGIKDISHIKVGDVLDISVDIKYGYQVSGMVDTLCFSPQAREYGYTPLSERVLYNVLDNANAAVDNFGSSLVKNAGRSRIGSNFHLYVEKSTGRVFQGNQWVKTYGLREFGSRGPDSPNH